MLNNGIPARCECSSVTCAPCREMVNRYVDFSRPNTSRFGIDGWRVCHRAPTKRFKLASASLPARVGVDRDLRLHLCDVCAAQPLGVWTIDREASC